MLFGADTWVMTKNGTGPTFAELLGFTPDEIHEIPQDPRTSPTCSRDSFSALARNRIRVPLSGAEPPLLVLPADA
jgi:hypothetical protein